MTRDVYADPSIWRGPADILSADEIDDRLAEAEERLRQTSGAPHAESHASAARVQRLARARGALAGLAAVGVDLIPVEPEHSLADAVERAGRRLGESLAALRRLAGKARRGR